MLSCTIASHQFGGCSMQYKNVIALQCPDARFAASFSLVGCCWPMVNYCMVLLKTLGTIIEMPLFFPLVRLNCFSAWWFEFSMLEGFSWFVQCTEGKIKRPQIAVATPRDLWVWISNKHRELQFSDLTINSSWVEDIFRVEKRLKKKNSSRKCQEPEDKTCSAICF